MLVGGEWILHINVKCTISDHTSTAPSKQLSYAGLDNLAIQGSSVPAEHAFSSAGLTDTILCNRLLPESLGAIQIVKSGYKNGWIKASEEAESISVLKSSSANWKKLKLNWTQTGSSNRYQFSWVTLFSWSVSVLPYHSKKENQFGTGSSQSFAVCMSSIWTARV